MLTKLKSGIHGSKPVDHLEKYQVCIFRTGVALFIPIDVPELNDSKNQNSSFGSNTNSTYANSTHVNSTHTNITYGNGTSANSTETTTPETLTKPSVTQNIVIQFVHPEDVDKTDEEAKAELLSPSIENSVSAFAPFFVLIFGVFLIIL